MFQVSDRIVLTTKTSTHNRVYFITSFLVVIDLTVIDRSITMETYNSAASCQESSGYLEAFFMGVRESQLKSRLIPNKKATFETTCEIFDEIISRGVQTEGERVGGGRGKSAGDAG